MPTRPSTGSFSFMQDALLDVEWLFKNGYTDASIEAKRVPAVAELVAALKPRAPHAQALRYVLMEAINLSGDGLLPFFPKALSQEALVEGLADLMGLTKDSSKLLRDRAKRAGPKLGLNGYDGVKGAKHKGKRRLTFAAEHIGAKLQTMGEAIGFEYTRAFMPNEMAGLTAAQPSAWVPDRLKPLLRFAVEEEWWLRAQPRELLVLHWEIEYELGTLTEDLTLVDWRPPDTKVLLNLSRQYRELEAHENFLPPYLRPEEPDELSASWNSDELRLEELLGGVVTNIPHNPVRLPLEALFGLGVYRVRLWTHREYFKHAYFMAPYKGEVELRQDFVPKILRLISVQLVKVAVRLGLVRCVEAVRIGQLGFF